MNRSTQCSMTALAVLLAALVGSVCAQAQPIQRIEIPSSFNPVGSGARALGMGGAFIAVADDATAASWNPGGLIQLEHPEVSAVGAFFTRTEGLRFGTNPEADGPQNLSKLRLNYLSVAYPFVWLDHNMVVSLNYQNLYDMTRSWQFPLQLRSTDLRIRRGIDYKQDGSLNALGLAYCLQVLPDLSFGFTLNYWGPQFNQWRQDTFESGPGVFAGFPLRSVAHQIEDFTFTGFNANVGVLWNITDKLSVGAVFKSPFTAQLKHELWFQSVIRFPTLPTPPSTLRSTFEEREQLDMPMSYGVGVAYRFSDALTIAADVYRSEWPDFVLIDPRGNEISPISSKPMAQSKVSATHQVRLGAEYLFITDKFVIPARGGVFYDPAPSEKGNDPYFGFTLGTGIGYGRFIFDVTYQYRFGRDVGKSILQNLRFSQDVDEHTLYASMIVHF